MMFLPLTQKQKRERYAPNPIGCSWVKVKGATPPLCSACSGTEADLAEAITRSCRLLRQSGGTGVDMAALIGEAALRRWRRRQMEAA